MPDRLIDPTGLFAPLRGAKAVGLAVSGGADSLALMLLAASYATTPEARRRFHVYSVDHGLRPEAQDEVAFVVAEAEKLGFHARPLRWEDEKPQTGIQQAARKARYTLIAEAMDADAVPVLLTAHHLGDQAETVLMRLAHGSGPQGLAAMRPVTAIDGMTLLRPLLGITRDSLLALLRQEGQDWIEDPSNGDPRYERVRARRLLAATAPLGLTPQRLAHLARRSARAADALDTLTAERFAALAILADGTVTLDADGFAAQPEDIRLRCLARAVRLVGAPAPLRLARLETLQDAVMNALGTGAALRRTLGGAAVLVARGRIRLAPEAPRRRGRTPPYGQY